MTGPVIVPAADKRLRALFAGWDAAGIKVCIWKSADRWEEGLAGDTDFDLLIAPHDLKQARQILINHGWLPVNAEGWRSFEGLSDYVSLQDQTTHHIHLHTHIVTGEKLIKSLRPPITDLYLAQTRAAYPPFVNSELEFILFIVRIIVKINWIDRLGAVKRRSASSLYRNYVAEYKPLRDATQRSDIQEMLAHPQLSVLPAEVILSAHDDLASIGWRARRRILKAIAPWRNVRGFPAWRKSRQRAQRKRQQGVGKTLEFPVPTIALCGPDGSGKTTLTEALQKRLGRQLRVSCFYMGSNLDYADRWHRAVSRGSWVPYLLVRKLFKVAGLRAAQSWFEERYLIFNQKFQRAQKSRRLLAAENASTNGHIVIFERYPLFTPFGDDLTPPIRQKSQMPDLLVMLDVSEATALARRGDDPAEVIKAKVLTFHNETRRLQSQGANMMVCAEGESVEDRVERIVLALNDLLVQRATAQRQ